PSSVSFISCSVSHLPRAVFCTLSLHDALPIYHVPFSGDTACTCSCCRPVLPDRTIIRRLVCRMVRLSGLTADTEFPDCHTVWYRNRLLYTAAQPLQGRTAVP